MNPAFRTGIALGSNLGDRLAHLQAARDLLRRFSTSGVLQAPVFQTEPMLCPEGSPDFYNTAIELTFPGSALELLKVTQEAECRLGRKSAAERNAPRVIDIDILYHGSTEIAEGPLVLPHPRLTQRRFVLQPLSFIRPDLVLPGQTETIRELLASLVSDEPPLARVATEW